MVFPLCKLSFRYGQEDWPDSELVGVGGEKVRSSDGHFQSSSYENL